MPDGTLDPAYGPGGMFSLPNFAMITAMTIDADGRLLVAGQDRAGAIVARYTLVDGLPDRVLSIAVTGRGTGTVSTYPVPLICAASCQRSLPYGSTMTLLAQPTVGTGMQFSGWLGDCTGREECTVSLTRPINVTATFAPSTQRLSLDVDGDGRYDALTDGLVLMRYLMGLTGPSLTAGIDVNTNGLAERLNELRPLLDIDGNGSADALTDGILILRSMFGMRDGSLVTGAIGASARRNSVEAITRYLQTVAP